MSSSGQGQWLRLGPPGSLVPLQLGEATWRSYSGLRANGCEWDSSAICLEAVEGGCLEMLEWLKGINSSEENEYLLLCTARNEAKKDFGFA